MIAFYAIKAKEDIMKLKTIGSNQTLLLTNHGYEILYSYETAVAGYSPVIGWFKSNKNYSKTTSKHVNAYLTNRVDIVLLTPEEIDYMGNQIGE